MKQAIVASMFLAAIVFAACNSSSSSATTKDTTASMPSIDTAGKMMASVKYTCKMHPEVISDTAGKCPKCGMEMVPMSDSAMSKMKMDSMPMKH